MERSGDKRKSVQGRKVFVEALRPSDCIWRQIAEDPTSYTTIKVDKVHRAKIIDSEGHASDNLRGEKKHPISRSASLIKACIYC